MNRKVILDESQEVVEVNPSKTRGRKPLVEDTAIIDAVKKLGADIFHKKSLRGEKDKCASWDLILLELKGQIKLHNLRMRILNKFEFFYSSLVSTYSQKESFVDSEKIDDYTVLDLNKFDTDVQDSRKAIRNLLNDSIYRPFISEIFIGLNN